MKGFATYGFLIFLIIIGAFYLIGNFDSRIKNLESALARKTAIIKEAEKEIIWLEEQNKKNLSDIQDKEKQLGEKIIEIQFLEEELSETQQANNDKDNHIEALEKQIQDTQMELQTLMTSLQAKKDEYDNLFRIFEETQNKLKSAEAQNHNYENITTWFKPLQNFSGLSNLKWVLGSILTTINGLLIWFTWKKLSRIRSIKAQYDPWKDPQFRKAQINRAKINEKNNRNLSK